MPAQPQKPTRNAIIQKAGYGGIRWEGVDSAAAALLLFSGKDPRPTPRNPPRQPGKCRNCVQCSAGARLAFWGKGLAGSAGKSCETSSRLMGEVGGGRRGFTQQHNTPACSAVRLQNGSGAWGRAAATQYEAAGRVGPAPAAGTRAYLSSASTYMPFPYSFRKAPTGRTQRLGHATTHIYSTHTYAYAYAHIAARKPAPSRTPLRCRFPGRGRVSSLHPATPCTLQGASAAALPLTRLILRRQAPLVTPLVIHSYDAACSVVRTCRQPQAPLTGR